MEQRARKFDVWREPFIKLRTPKIFNLRRDPFERADTDSNNYNHWWSQRVYIIGPAQMAAMTFLQTYKEFPPRQKPAAFNLDEVMRNMEQQIGGK
jgi:arylsulfatase